MDVLDVTMTIVENQDALLINSQFKKMLFDVMKLKKGKLKLKYLLEKGFESLPHAKFFQY